MAHSKLAERGKKKPMISYAAVAPLLMIGRREAALYFQAVAELDA